MCMYNIAMNDELVSEARRSFSSKAAMDAWLQQQVEALLVAHNARMRRRFRPATNHSRREAAMLFVKNLSVSGGQPVPADERGIDALIREKYDCLLIVGIISGIRCCYLITLTKKDLQI